MGLRGGAYSSPRACARRLLQRGQRQIQSARPFHSAGTAPAKPAARHRRWSSIDRHTLIRDVNCERRSHRVAAAASGNGCGGVMCYTSGTSAAPKAVPHSFQSLLPIRGNACRFASSPAMVLSAAPLTHAFGLYVAHVALMGGATFVPPPVFSPSALAHALHQHRPTHAFVAPAHIAALLKTEVIGGRQFEDLRQVVLSGSYCPPALKRALEERLANGCVFELWGMTETFVVLLGDPREPTSTRHDTIGRPTIGSAARVSTWRVNHCRPILRASCRCAAARYLLAILTIRPPIAGFSAKTAGCARVISPS